MRFELLQTLEVEKVMWDSAPQPMKFNVDLRGRMTIESGQFELPIRIGELV